MAPTHALERRWRLTHRALPALGGLALVAFGTGLGFGAAYEPASERVARDFVRAWERTDYRTMHRLLDDDSRRRFPFAAFRSAYADAAAIATATAIRAGNPEPAGDSAARVPVTVSTRVFGTVRGELLVPVPEERVSWRPQLVFPGVPPGAELTRDTEAPLRAKILSADGQTLAEGPAGARTSPVDGVGSSIAGTVSESSDPEERDLLFRRGFPADTPVGQSGLERALQRRVEGTPGGNLLAGERVLASSIPLPAEPVRSTIDTAVQAASVTALAGRLGGIAALDPRTGEIRALAGIAFSAPQPPGSVFKIVTTVAALEDGLVKPSDEFPILTEATIDGVALENANGTACGGTFRDSFANSCNSVFAPLGVEVGAERLVDAAERFGWNDPARIPGAQPSTLPPADEFASPLEVGASAIGQGRVLATPLQMASVAQTIANRGVRVEPTVVRSADGRRERVTSRRVATTIGRLMVGVVDYGTGTLAQVPGVRVAGKTGTAELEDTRGPDAEAVSGDPSNTDAWFTAFAPRRRPRIAVAALFVRNGAGGTVAAPAAQIVLATAVAP